MVIVNNGAVNKGVADIAFISFGYTSIPRSGIVGPRGSFFKTIYFLVYK